MKTVNTLLKPVKVKKVTKKKTRGLSDANLLRLRREVVYSLFGNCCFFCGKPKGQVELQDHHFGAKRKMFLLRYDWRNGLPVCEYGCHSYAETPTGKHLINEYILKNGFMEYLQERSGNCKDFLLARKMTKDDYRLLMYNDLTAKLRELK